MPKTPAPRPADHINVPLGPVLSALAGVGDDTKRYAAAMMTAARIAGRIRDTRKTDRRRRNVWAAFSAVGALSAADAAVFAHFLPLFAPQAIAYVHEIRDVATLNYQAGLARRALAGYTGSLYGEAVA